MCRRRILAIILSLALVASCFVFSVYADDTTWSNFQVTIDGVNYAIVDGNVTVTKNIPAHSSATVNITQYNSTKGDFDDSPVAVKFELLPYFQISNALTTNSHIYYSNITNTNNVSSVSYTTIHLYDEFGNEAPTYEVHEYRQYNIGMYFECFCASNYRGLASSITFKNDSDYNIQFRFKITNVQISPAFNWFYGQILMPALSLMQSTLTNINTAVTSLNQAFVLYDDYSYYRVYYDQNGDSHVQEIDNVNWLEAMRGMLFSITQPIAHQVEQEQMARDAGFQDVLEDAYDHSSPGDFLDFLSIGEIANWDEGAYDDAQSDAITYWFSQSCKDNIDSVPVVRGQEPQVIDFYSTHISEYWEALGIDTTYSGSD